MNQGCASCPDVDAVLLLHGQKLSISPDTADKTVGYSAAQTIRYLFVDDVKGPETLVTYISQLVGIF
ncbi:MAG: hypothetical protein QXD24_02175 [Candidatus Caldarchaeum sp.]